MASARDRIDVMYRRVRGESREGRRRQWKQDEKVLLYMEERAELGSPERRSEVIGEIDHTNR